MTDFLADNDGFMTAVNESRDNRDESLTDDTADILNASVSNPSEGAFEGTSIEFQ